MSINSTIMKNGARYIDIHTHYPSQREDVIEVINLDQGDLILPSSGFFSYGIHPWNIGEWIHSESHRLDLMRNEDCIAIGECGLDFFRKEIPRKAQEAVFRSQLDIARNLSKPVIIHAVKSIPDIIRIRKSYRDSPPWIIHGFNGNPIEVKQLIHNGFFISLGKHVLAPSEKLHKSILDIPLSQLFLETDNDKNISIDKIYESVARLKSIQLDTLKNELYSNFLGLFFI